MTDYPPGSGPPPRVFAETEAYERLAAGKFGTLATIKADGHPHLSTMIYTWDPDRRVILMSTTQPRVKVRHIQANPRTALHVPGPDAFSYVTAEGEAEVSAVTTSPGDEVGRALAPLYGDVDQDALFKQLVLDRRVLITLRVTKVYGMAIEF